jgi:hypothetical protein
MSPITRLTFPKCYQESRRLIDQTCHKHANFGMVAGQLWSYKMVPAVACNLQVGPHLDKGDDDNGVVTMSPLGEVDGVDLLVGIHEHFYKLAYPGEVRVSNTMMLVPLTLVKFAEMSSFSIHLSFGMLSRHLGKAKGPASSCFPPKSGDL